MSRLRRMLDVRCTLTLYVTLGVHRKPVNPDLRGPGERSDDDLEVTRERLTRERIVDAALHVMDTEGLDAVTMRRVAREVGAEAMSLVPPRPGQGRPAAGVCDRVMAQLRVPRGRRGLGRPLQGGSTRLASAPPGASGLDAPVRRDPRAGPHLPRLAPAHRVRAPVDPRRRTLRPRHGPSVPRVRRLHPGLRDDGRWFHQGRRSRRALRRRRPRERASPPTRSRCSARSAATSPSATPTSSSSSASI